MRQALEYAVLDAVEHALYLDTTRISRAEFERDGKTNARVGRLHPLTGRISRIEHFSSALVDTREPRNPVGFIWHEPASPEPPLKRAHRNRQAVGQLLIANTQRAAQIAVGASFKPVLH